MTHFLNLFFIHCHDQLISVIWCRHNRQKFCQSLTDDDTSCMSGMMLYHSFKSFYYIIYVSVFLHPFRKLSGVMDGVLQGKIQLFRQPVYHHRNFCLTESKGRHYFAESWFASELRISAYSRDIIFSVPVLQMFEDCIDIWEVYIKIGSPPRS